MATLPDRSAMVCVGPPLLASGPSFGSATRPGQVLSGYDTLPPRSCQVGVVSSVAQLPPVFLAMIVFLRSMLPPAKGNRPRKRPPPATVAVFPAIVLL